MKTVTELMKSCHFADQTPSQNPSPHNISLQKAIFRDWIVRHDIGIPVINPSYNFDPFARPQGRQNGY